MVKSRSLSLGVTPLLQVPMNCRLCSLRLFPCKGRKFFPAFQLFHLGFKMKGLSSRKSINSGGK